MGFLNSLFGAKNEYQASQMHGSQLDNASADQVNQQQADLAQALTAASQGQGPSVVQQQLTDATGQIANQGAGAIASAKGINPALQAKMILDQQAGALSTAAGQSAVLKANEQTEARKELANALSTQRGQDISQQTARNQGISAQNQSQLGADKINADVQAGNAKQSGSIAGGVLGGIGGLLGLSDGGEIPEFIKKFSAGGDIPDFATSFAAGKKAFGSSSSGDDGDDDDQGAAPEKKPLFDLGGMLRGGIQSLFSPAAPDAAGGYSGPTSYDYATMYGAPGGASANPTSQDYANMYGAPGANEQSNMFQGAVNFKATGGKIPGKANVEGDSPENDTVLTVTSPGEVVIPRTASRDPEKAAEFVEALNKSREKKAGSGGYADVLRAQEALHNRLAQIERFCYGGRAA